MDENPASSLPTAISTACFFCKHLRVFATRDKCESRWSGADDERAIVQGIFGQILGSVHDFIGILN